MIVFFLLPSPANAGGQLKSKNGQKYIINHRNDGFFITKKHIILIALLIAIVMAAVFLLTYYLLAHRWVTCAHCNRFYITTQWFQFRIEIQWNEIIDSVISAAVKQTVWEEEMVQMRYKQLASWARMGRQRQKQRHHQQPNRLQNQQQQQQLRCQQQRKHRKKFNSVKVGIQRCTSKWTRSTFVWRHAIKEKTRKDHFHYVIVTLSEHRMVFSSHKSLECRESLLLRQFVYTLYLFLPISICL